MEIKIYLEIGKKYHENNEKLRIGRKEKKKWFVRLRDELTVKKKSIIGFGIYDCRVLSTHDRRGSWT